MNLAEMRARVRKDLHDEDAQNYRWSDSELERHIAHAVQELSLSVPLQAKATLTTGGKSGYFPGQFDRSGGCRGS